MGAAASDIFFFPVKHLLKEIIVYPPILFFHYRHPPVNRERLKKTKNKIRTNKKNNETILYYFLFCF